MRANRLAPLVVLLLLAASSVGCAMKHDGRSTGAGPQQVVPAVADAKSAAGEQAPEARKIIRKAELRLRADDVAGAQRSAIAVAEKWGGYVASTDARSDGEGDAQDVTTVVLRIPSTHFAAALAELRGTGTRVEHEKVTGEDVTEQYVDVEARLRVSRALEERLLGLLKETKTIKDALDVEKQLAEVRGEIERAEGRRRLLADQTSLATFTVTIARRMPVAAMSGQGLADTVRDAARDGVSLFWFLVRAAIRVVGVLVPLGLLFGLPWYVAVRLVRRRRTLSA